MGWPGPRVADSVAIHAYGPREGDQDSQAGQQDQTFHCASIFAQHIM